MGVKLLSRRKKERKDEKPVFDGSGHCPTCREFRHDLFSPCPYCGEVE